MAATSVSGGSPSISKVGTLASGLTARYSGLCCSPSASDTNRRSKSAPISCNAMCTAIELDPGEKYSVSMNAPSWTSFGQLVTAAIVSLDEPVHRGGIGPAQYRDDVVF